MLRAQTAVVQLTAAEQSFAHGLVNWDGTKLVPTECWFEPTAPNAGFCYRTKAPDSTSYYAACSNATGSAIIHFSVPYAMIG